MAELNQNSVLRIAFGASPRTEPTANQNNAAGIDIIGTMGRRGLRFVYGSEQRTQPGDKTHNVRQSLRQVNMELDITLDYVNVAADPNRTSVFYDKDWADCTVYWYPDGTASGGHKYQTDALCQATIQPGGDGAMEVVVRTVSNGLPSRTTV